MRRRAGKWRVRVAAQRLKVASGLAGCGAWVGEGKSGLIVDVSWRARSRDRRQSTGLARGGRWRTGLAGDTRRCGAYYEAVSREVGELTLECAIAGLAAGHGVSDGALGWRKTQEGAGRRRAYLRRWAGKRSEDGREKGGGETSDGGEWFGRKRGTGEGTRWGKTVKGNQR